MLGSIRKYTNSIFIKIFLFILAGAFIICFGMSDIIRKVTGKDYVVKVGKYKISPMEFKIEKAKKRELLKTENIDEKTQTIYLLHQLVWDTLKSSAAKDFGFLVSDYTIKDYISGMYEFRDKSGRFDGAMLRRFLAAIHLPEPAFIELSKRNIEEALIRFPFRYVNVQSEYNGYVSSLLEKRKISFIKLMPSAFKITETPSESELEEFYSNHSALFMADEVRSFKLLTLNENEIEAKIKITEEDLKEAYEYSPERDSKTFEELKNELNMDLKNERFQNEINDITRQIEDELINNDINETAKKFDLQITEFSTVNEANKTKDNKEAVSVDYKNEVVKMAFSTEEGADSQFSESMDKKSRILWIVHVDSITPKHVKPFADVKNVVKAAWIKERQKEKTLEIAQKIANEVKEGTTLRSLLHTIAKDYAKTFKETEEFDRNGELEKAKKDDKKASHKKSEFAPLIAGTFERAFKLDKNEAHYQEIDGEYIVFQVTKISSTELKNDKEKLRYHAKLLKEMTEDLYQQLISYLSKKYDVKINFDILKEINEEVEPNDLKGIF